MYSFSDSFDGYDPANYAQGTPVPAPDEDFERAWGMLSVAQILAHDEDEAGSPYWPKTLAITIEL